VSAEPDQSSVEIEQGSPAAEGALGSVSDQRSEQDRHSDECLEPEQGLSSKEAAARLQRYGPNALEEHERSVLLELLSHFWAPIPWMIEAALILTAMTARWPDFGIILALLLLNGIVGFWVEHRGRTRSRR
jgi:H+-transporting ATPase